LKLKKIKQGGKMNELSIMRLEPNGPADIGLKRDEPDPADYQSSLPVLNAYSYYEDKDLGLYVGVWDSTASQEVFLPYSMDEFMWLIEGQVAMVDENDDETIVKAGEAFVIPKGLPCSWKLEGYLKKFYMIYDAPNSTIPKAPTATRIVIPQADAPLERMKTTDPLVIKGKMPIQKDHTCYEDTTGQMFVGTWESTPFESEMRPFPYYEMAHILEGSVTIVNDKESEHFFKTGDTFFIPKGTICSWKTTETVRKFYSMFQPAE
jgi:uncharacterized cupin superfamily protein